MKSRRVDLFVYGTLMDENLVFELTGKRFARIAAVLRDFEKVQPDGGYPYIVPRVGPHVTGLLLRDIDASSLARIDEYEDEGRLYRRTEVVVEIGGERRRCESYIGFSHETVET